MGRGRLKPKRLWERGVYGQYTAGAPNEPMMHDGDYDAHLFWEVARKSFARVCGFKICGMLIGRHQIVRNGPP